MNSYSEAVNPYKQWHMQRAFRLGWEAAEDNLSEDQAAQRIPAAKLNSQTRAAWWRGYRARGK